MTIELIVAIALILLVGGGLALRSRSRPSPALDSASTERTAELPSPADTTDRPEDADDRPDQHTPAETGAPAFGTFRPPSRPSSAAVLPIDKPRRAVASDGTTQVERYRAGLRKTRGGFVARLADLFRGKPTVDAALRDQVEEILLTADIGARTAELLFSEISELLDRDTIADPSAVWAALHKAASDILSVPAEPLNLRPAAGPYVLLMIGVNGVGKTTTLGKLAAQHRDAGHRVLLVAGDTFRAAASEQLDIWAQRVGCDIHQGKPGADPSAVIYEGISRARREGHDVVLCDTAGRLHTRKELMDELQKIRRAASKALSSGRPETVEPHDIFLVLDATIGQNALAQARMFKETMAFSGLVITKLDGTAKGGVVLGVCHELELPIRYIGVGERIDDLRPFDADAFCDGLLARTADEAAQS